MTAATPTDLCDRTVVITGATAGIGRAAAMALARRGAALSLVARNPEKARATAKDIQEASGNDRTRVFAADLSRQADIHRVADALLAAHPRIDVLVNNAGVVCTSFGETPDGIETTFAVNHLAYFLLTERLRERLVESAPARVVSTASDAHRFLGAFPFDDPECRRRYRGLRAYAVSKLANVMWNAELARRLAGTGVTANALHPGGVNTGLGDQNGGGLRVLGQLVKRFLATPEQGAETLVHLVCAPELVEASGGYYARCAPRKPGHGARDPEADARLWALSVAMTS